MTRKFSSGSGFLRYLGVLIHREPIQIINFIQVYVIMGKFATGKAIPCGWSLLPNNKEESYMMMFDAIMLKVNREGREDFKPSAFSVDFEMSVIIHNSHW